MLSFATVWRVQRCTQSLFTLCFMQSDEEFQFHGTGSPDEIFSIYVPQENRENLFWR